MKNRKIDKNTKYKNKRIDKKIKKNKETQAQLTQVCSSSHLAISACFYSYF